MAGGHIIPEAGPEDDAPRSRRSTAQVTYETVARMDNMLAGLVYKVDLVFTRSVETEKKFQDHEARLRILETAQAVALAASTSRKEGMSTLHTAWMILIATATVVFGAVNLYLNMKGH